MTDVDFKRWFKRHRAAFPELDSWLAKQPNGDEVLATWRAALRDVSFDAACSVSHGMGIGDIPAPRVFGETARVVRKEAIAVAGKEGRRPRPIDGQRTVHCAFCEDDGYVRCWHPQPTAYARRYRKIGPRFRAYTAVVTCCCAAGDERLKQRWAEEVRRSGRQPPRYYPQRWCRITKIRYSEQLEELLAWCAAVGCKESTADDFHWEPQT